MTSLGMLFVAILVVIAAGAGVFARVLPKRPIDLFECIGFGILMGSGFVSLVLFALAPLFSGKSLVMIVVLLSIACFGAGVSRLRAAAWITPRGARWYVAAFSAALAVVAWQAFAQPLAGDGLFNFEVRARLAWLNGGRIPPEFFPDPSRSGMHQSYPLFVPLNELWLYLCAGSANQSLVKVLGAFWFAGCVSLTFSRVTAATNGRAKGLVSLALMLAVPAIVFSRGGAVWTWGDFPLGAAALGAALYLAEYYETGTGLVCFSAMLSMLPWIKREGLVIGVALLLALAWKSARQRQWRAMIKAAVPFLMVAFAWKLFVSATDAPTVGDFETPSADFLTSHLDRLPRVAAIAGRELLVWQRWSILWPIALLAWIRIGREPALARWRPLVAVNVALIVVYPGLYVFSAWPNLTWHMITSLPRLLLPPAMLAVVLVAVAIPLSSQNRADR